MQTKLWDRVVGSLDEVAIVTLYVAVIIANRVLELGIPDSTLEALSLPVMAYLGVTGAKAVAAQVAVRQGITAAEALPTLRDLRTDPERLETLGTAEVGRFGTGSSREGVLLRLDDGRSINVEVDAESGQVTGRVVD